MPPPPPPPPPLLLLLLLFYAVVLVSPRYSRGRGSPRRLCGGWIERIHRGEAGKVTVWETGIMGAAAATFKRGYGTALHCTCTVTAGDLLGDGELHAGGEDLPAEHGPFPAKPLPRPALCGAHS